MCVYCIILDSGSSEAISHTLHLVFSCVNNSTRSHLQWLITKEQLFFESILIHHCLLLWEVVVIDSSAAAIFHFSLHLQLGEADGNTFFMTGFLVPFFCLCSLMIGILIGTSCSGWGSVCWLSVFPGFIHAACFCLEWNQVQGGGLTKMYYLVTVYYFY